MKKALAATAALAASTPVHAVSVVSLHAGVVMSPPVASAGMTLSLAGLLVLASVVGWRFVRRRTH